MAGLYVLLFFIYPAIPAERNSSTILLFLAVFFAHALVGWSAYRVWKNHLTVRAFWILFLLPRIFTSPMLPWLSDDVYSYLWHGHLTMSGQNVYAHVPLAPEYVPFRTEVFERMGNMGIPAIYPQLSEMTMALAVGCGSIFSSSWVAGLIFWKVILLASEIAGMLLLIKVDRLVKLRSSTVLPMTAGFALYIFAPIPVVEIIGQGHLDGLLFAPLGAALLLMTQWMQRRMDFPVVKAGIMGAILFLLKFTPAVIFLPLARTGVPLRRAAAAGCLAAVIIAACAIPFFIHPAAWNTFSQGLIYYNEQASFNGVPLYLVRRIAALFSVPLWWIVAPKVLSVIRSAAVLLFGLHRPVDSYRTLLQRILLVYACAIVIAGKVHVWYFAPLLFVNVLVGSLALVFSTNLMMLSYAAYLPASPQELYWLEYIVWTICAGLVIIEWRKNLGLRTIGE
ncbi:MAG: glycosyltransferase 87 family protein [Ignavibacteriales bacterium]|nr:glycosyltransferase 87 family protein [Ignavibacteriales bacterium]